ncbi:MAG TPA: signal peptide peptidase SppA [Rubrivivax sp.]|nr:signal peptide peptidase SppA [Rubrivivax sp.]
MPSTTFTSRIGRALRSTWWLLDATRRTLLNLLLLLLLGALLWALWQGFSGPPALKEKTALVIDLSGRLVEQFSSTSLRDGALQRIRGSSEEPQTRLRDVLQALEAATKDDKITHAVLVLDGLGPAGLPKLREVAAALERFKAAGKPVIAWGDSYDQRQYYLAAHASEVWLHPMGEIGMEGYGRHRSYYKDLFDRIGVSANVIRAGKFKSAGETFSASGPSPETLESDGALYGALWSSWTGGVEKARKLPAGSLMAAIDSLPDSLVAEGGHIGQWAIKRGLVDALKTRDQMRAAMIERGARQESDSEAKTQGGGTFRQVNLADYRSRLKPNREGDAIGVIVAQGPISSGMAGPGRIGGRSTAELVRKAREDKAIKAVVLRVDSPGGSAFGSELVRRELELTRAAGKPVVVSMGDLAASGGYWISMAADEMIADEATITGSIGVVAMLPTAQGAADKLGIRTGGVTTTWLGQAYDPRSGVDPRFAQLVQSGVDRVYRDFTALAAGARKTTPDKIDAVAQGRVWAGRQALERGLVDRTGSYLDALKSAATRAKLADGKWHTKYIEAEPGRWAQLLQRLGINTDASLSLPSEVSGSLLIMLGLGGLPLGEAASDLGWLLELAQQRTPYTALVHCLCSAP